MPTGLALVLLAFSLAVTLAAARTFARRLDALGVALGMPEALLGLLTALAADGPEISSALAALAKGEHGVGIGVVIGSNAFNLAAMIGLSALLSGAVVLRRSALAIEGSVGVAATLLAAGVLLEWISPVLGALLFAGVGVPYLVILVRSRPHTSHEQFDRALDSASRSRHAGAHAARAADVELTDAHAAHAANIEFTGAHATDAGLSGDAPANPALAGGRSHARTVLWMAGDIALIVAGSFGMVVAASSLGGRLSVSGALVGVLVLGPLTSIPNAVTGVRLGLARRGAALVSETLNSNTINLAAGIMIPALLITVSATSRTGHLELAWLLGMTLVCLLALARTRGAGRGAGALLVALYAGFVVIQLTS